jgi:glycosyltransferase involved in cell wall biosynthesis
LETSWTIIIFLYNEQGNVKSAIEQVVNIGQCIDPVSFQLVIVNDGSTDNTHSIIQESIQGKDFVTYLKHETNKGIGEALKGGYRLARNANVCAVPGDCQFDYKELLACPTFDNTQFISYYRKRTRYNPYRWFLNVFNRVMNHAFLGLRMNDVNWVKVYKNNQLQYLDLTMTSSLVESEICAKLVADGVECVELESKYLERKHDDSKGGAMKTVVQALGDMLKLICVVYKYKQRKNHA